ncbi:MAG: hypothetical protein J7K40_11505 [candidate division Zixibacteria bacterium]|nr:hypothetical protein [candidate division Zixibacteria bacterium]
MANKYDLKIANIPLLTGVMEVGDQVPLGKTRFVCFIKHSAVTGGTVAIGEGVDADTMTTVKDTTVMEGGGILAYPDNIDMDNPLFSITPDADNEKWLVVESTIDDGTVTVVYFDE